MPLATCARCKKMFNKVDGVVCISCQPDEDADCDKVRDVLERNANLNADEVAAEAEVDVSVVRRMLDQGMVRAATAGDILCGRCGEPAISASKRLCQKCLDKLNAEMLQAKTQIAEASRRVTQGFHARSEEGKR